MYPRLLQLGHIAIPTYGVFTALALIAGLMAAVFFARRIGVDPNKVWTLCLIGISTTLVAARLLLVFGHLDVFRQHPFWVLGLTDVHEQWVVAISGFAGVGAAALYALAEGLPLLRTLDALAPCAAVAIAINRVGAFLGGLDYGVPVALPWSVTYTSRIAALWYRTPLGIELHPVQLYDAGVSLGVLVFLLWWMRRGSRTGEVAGAWLFLYGFARFFLSFFYTGSEALPVSELMAFLGVIAGGVLWLRRTPGAEAP